MFARASAVTTSNSAAQYNLGVALDLQGRTEETLQHYREAIRIRPTFSAAHANLGRALYYLGRSEEAINELTRALELASTGPAADIIHFNLALALVTLTNYEAAASNFASATRTITNNPSLYTEWGKMLLNQGGTDAAIAQFEQAFQIDPEAMDAHFHYGIALTDQGKPELAAWHLAKALRLEPKEVGIYAQIGLALASRGKVKEAVTHYRESLRLQPDMPEVLNNFAWILATSADASLRDGKEAVQFAQRACELTGNQQTLLIGTLAAAYAEAGRFEDAQKTAEQAIALAAKNGETDLAEKNRELLRLYQAGKPHREKTDAAR